jgi:Tol biopolymer transport system component
MSRIADVLERESRTVDLEPGDFERLLTRRERKQRNRRISAGAVGVIVALAVGFALVRSLTSDAVPTNPPEPRPSPTTTTDLGIFEPIAGRIAYCVGSDLGAVDPNAPSPVSTLEIVGDHVCAPTNTFPIGWSSDGTELLFARQDPDDIEGRYLYLLHADGTEIQVTPERVGGATISPDGSRVVFADDDTDWLYVIDIDGGEPVRIAKGEEPTFSPDGTQIAYLTNPRSGCCVGRGREHVWVMEADGTGAHEILTDEPALDKGVFGLVWSPAGDRIAMENTLGRYVAIYTFAPDGSEFTKVITGGANPSWSPDGSQIAYVVLGEGFGGLQIADADGSNVRSLGFGTSGPWHPGASSSSV